jgi:hypothetical protein
VQQQDLTLNLGEFREALLNLIGKFPGQQFLIGCRLSVGTCSMRGASPPSSPVSACTASGRARIRSILRLRAIRKSHVENLPWVGSNRLPLVLVRATRKSTSLARSSASSGDANERKKCTRRRK